MGRVITQECDGCGKIVIYRESPGTWTNPEGETVPADEVLEVRAANLILGDACTECLGKVRAFFKGKQGKSE